MHFTGPYLLHEHDYIPANMCLSKREYQQHVIFALGLFTNLSAHTLTRATSPTATTHQTAAPALCVCVWELFVSRAATAPSRLAETSTYEPNRPTL
jgi:hypothetical protein